MQRNPYWPLNGPSFFFDHRDSVTVYFHSLSKSRSRLRAQISRRGWQADVTSSRLNQTGTPGPAGASFERNFFDFVETSQDPDVHRTTSTVSANQDLARRTLGNVRQDLSLRAGFAYQYDLKFESLLS